jgi:hypothetical protein
MDCDFQRGQVIAGPRLFRLFQHPREHRRHELRVRHLVLLDEAQKVLECAFSTPSQRTIVSPLTNVPAGAGSSRLNASAF